MNKHLLIIACVMLFINTFSQVTEQHPLLRSADSLQEIGQYEKAIARYREYLDSRGKVRYDKNAVAESYVNIGLCLYKMDKYAEAIKYFHDALELQKELGDQDGMASSLNNIGLNYKKLGDYEQAIDYYEQTVKMDEMNGNVAEMAMTYNNIGMIYRVWGKYDRAIDYFDRSLAIRKNLNDQAGMSKSLNNMGLVYSEWKKYEQAIQIFRESLVIEQSLNNESEVALRYNNIGRVYFYMEQYDTALAYFESSLEILERKNEQSQVALLYNNIGKIYLAREQNAEAASFFTEALEIFGELGMAPEKTTVLANLGNIYHKLGQEEKAIQMLDSSTRIASGLNMKSQLQHNYKNLSDFYSSLKDYERSLFYYRKYSELKDSVFSNETLRQLSDFQAKYEKAKDQTYILSLEKENLQKTNQRNGYLFTAIGIIIIALFLIIYFRQRAKNIRIITSQQIRQLEEEKKLMAAKLMVEAQEAERKRIATELHDGLGVLLSATKMHFSTIQKTSPENKEVIERAAKMLEQASSDVRKISHNMMPGLLTKLGFFEAVEDLFEKVGDTQDLMAVCKIEGEKERFAENSEIMLYRIVQEMVNNTMKHARAKKIDMKISKYPDRLDINYADDGKGFDLTEKVNSESLGLQSIRSRVNFLNGKMELVTQPGKGVIYSIVIPM